VYQNKVYPKPTLGTDGQFLVINNQSYTVTGTTASTIVVASMITLINDARITAGKKPVGFINPTVCFSSIHRWTLKLKDL
jgi:tripeptidyl-peptidase I